MNEVLARVHKRICSTVLCFCTVIPEIYAKANRKKDGCSMLLDKEELSLPMSHFPSLC